MSEKQFILCQDDLGNYEIRYDDGNEKGVGR